MAEEPYQEILTDQDAETIDAPLASREQESMQPRSLSADQILKQRKVPKKIGRYSIRRAIASGGMGTVYEATQENPRRVVAVKVLKQGITSKSTLRRFEYESQVLGRLRHPGIAQVYEAGVHETEDGAMPFFAMEYIAGAKGLTQFADDKKLDTRERMALFVKVCDAVYHGHQKGIIHRDLKPDNILVDSSGQPKIIDYGVARAADSDMAVTTVQTEIGQLIGTLHYMSPEQIEADPNDIDTRSDVYSLGVVLYKMLTGRHPYELKDAPVYEATRIIREQAPTRISTIDNTLKGDVETIVLHALEKDREHRYQSAHALAQDIERYLSDQPILAHPPSLSYMLSRFAKRNKALVAAGTVVTLAIIASVIGISLAMVQARIGHEKARLEAETANATTAFFQKSFASLDPRDGAGPNARVSDLLDDAVANIDLELEDQPRVQARLHHSFGLGYKALTLYDKSEKQLRKALVLQREDQEIDDLVLAETLHDLASVLWFRRNFEEAESMFREALELRQEHLGTKDLDVARTMDYLAATLTAAGRPEEAEDLYRRSLTIRREIQGPRHEVVARSMNNLGTCLQRLEKWTEAEQMYRDSIDIVREIRGPNHMDVAGGLTNLARLLVKTNRANDAEPLYREALSIKRRVLRPDHSSIAITLHHLASLLHDEGRDAEARPMAEEALDLRMAKYLPSHAAVVESIELLAAIADSMGDDAEAARLRQQLPE